MNYLTKFYLAGHSKNLLVGCFLASEMSDKKLKINTTPYREGIVFCRKLDDFITSHPAFLRSKKYISPLFHKHTDEILKLYQDHFLAVRWNDYSDYSLGEFSKNVSIVLSGTYQEFPYKNKQVFEAIAKSGGIENYGHLHGFHEAVKFLARKTGKMYAIHTFTDLINAYPELSRNFNELFTDLIAFAELARPSVREEVEVVF